MLGQPPRPKLTFVRAPHTPTYAALFEAPVVALGEVLVLRLRRAFQCTATSFAARATADTAGAASRRLAAGAGCCSSAAEEWHHGITGS